MAGRERRPELSALSIVVQTEEYDRQIAVYTYDAPDHPEGYRTFACLQVDDAMITDQYGARLSA